MLFRSLLFEHDYADDEGLLSWILSCRDMATVLEPESIREELFRIASELADKYRNKGDYDNEEMV